MRSRLKSQAVRLRKKGILMVENIYQMRLDLDDLAPRDDPPRDEVSHLITEAQGRLREGDRRAAIWRLIDAAGLLCEEFPTDATAREGTDRRFRITRAGHGFGASRAAAIIHPDCMGYPGD